MKTYYPKPFQRSPDDLERFKTTITHKELQPSLNSSWVDMEFVNEPLFARLRWIGGMVIAQQIDRRGDEEKARALGNAYLAGSIVAYHTLTSGQSPYDVPRIDGKILSNLMQDAPRSEHEELVWHFALEGDEILRTMLDLAMDDLHYETDTMPAFYNGAGLVNHIFNSYQIMAN